MLCPGGKSVSAWHDIPLWAEDGLLNFICEIPKESSAKMEVATVGVPAVSVNFPLLVICTPFTNLIYKYHFLACKLAPCLLLSCSASALLPCSG